ncbi:lysophospholipid acyltransferase family protein [Nocardioides campestrisoli]|uniref:lysophospholipid acyltransferase family protein n=1 Tax=Nocardioides campestrisoli TaxID=2736757 RepID=UPI0015E71BAE|nr:lysophospholipid acyltransferase family protein [Nocardioides campestrisoli]
MTSAELPPSSERHPPTRLLALGRPVARRLVSAWYDVRISGAPQVPSDGPVILAANHIGWLDGPLLAALAPRPVHALTKTEMFHGAAGKLLCRAGQIPLDRFRTDMSAVRQSLRVLRDGGTLGIFPEGKRGPGDLRRFHHGAAYLALVTGAPVVPVTFFGTRLPGGSSDSVPPRGARIDLVHGESWQVDQQPWPRTKEQVLHASVLLLQHMRRELDRARALTGRDLPGPLPAGQTEKDPDTGFVKRGTP